MRYLRTLGLVLMAIGVTLLWTFGATAQKTFVRYPDGKTAETSPAIKQNAEIPVADKGPVLTMDAHGWIEEDGGPIKVVRPGQRVILWIGFVFTTRVAIEGFRCQKSISRTRNMVVVK